MSYTTFAKRRDTDKQSLSRWPPITRRVVYFVVKIYFLGKTKQSIQVLSMIWEYVLREWIFDEENQINLKQPTRKKNKSKGDRTRMGDGFAGHSASGLAFLLLGNWFAINTCLVWWRSQCRGRVFKTRVSYQKGWRQPWESVVKIAITLGYASGEVRVIIPRKMISLISALRNTLFDDISSIDNSS